MKQFVYGTILTVIIMLSIGIVLTVNGQATRQAEVDNSLQTAVQDAVEATMNEKSYDITDNEEFLADFTQHLLMQVSSDSDIEVQAAGVDYKKGLLSLRVTEEYRHPNGNEGKNSCETTVVFESVPSDGELVTVTYRMDEENIYKEYQIEKGEDIIVPREPVKEGKAFAGWKDAAGHMVTVGGAAQQDVVYTAVWN